MRRIKKTVQVNYALLLIITQKKARHSNYLTKQNAKIQATTEKSS